MKIGGTKPKKSLIEDKIIKKTGCRERSCDFDAKVLCEKETTKRTTNFKKCIKLTKSS